MRTLSIKFQTETANRAEPGNHQFWSEPSEISNLVKPLIYILHFFLKVKALKNNFVKTDIVEERIRRDRPPARTSQAERKKKVNEWNKQATRQVPLIHP